MGEVADALRRAHTRERQPARHQERRLTDRDDSAVLRPTPRPDALDQALTAPIPQEPLKERPARPTRAPQSLLRAEHTGRPERICLEDPSGAFAQQYHRLGIRLRNMTESQGARSIVVTSSNPSDGKTTTACNLAVALAVTDHDCRVALVDLDLHRASVAHSLNLRVETPVEAVLRGESDLEEAIIETDIGRLCVVGADASSKEPTQLLASQHLAVMIRTLSHRFDWVIIDTPPMLVTSAAQIVLQQADTALLVARAGFSPVRDLKESMKQLPEGKVLASVMNSGRTPSKVGYYDYYSDTQVTERAGDDDVEITDVKPSPSPREAEASHGDRA